MGLREFASWLDRTRVSNRPYLIQARFYGYAEKFALHLSREIARLFGARLVLKKSRPVRMVLYGRFGTGNEKEAIRRFVAVCSRFDVVTFEIAGFDHIANKAFSLKINPSDELVNLRNSLALELNPVCESQEWDKPGDFDFRAVLPLVGVQEKFESIWKFLEAKKKPEISQYLLRASLLKKGEVLKEYDFIQRRVLGGRSASKGSSLSRTKQELKTIIQNDGKRKPSI